MDAALDPDGAAMATPDPQETGTPPEGREDLQANPRESHLYFLIADSTEGPTAPIDPDTVTRRAARAMERLLREAETDSSAAAG